MSDRALPPRSRPYRRLLRRNESGAALLEFAIVAIPFFFILYGLVVLGMALAVKQSVQSAAADGARSAVGIADPTTAANTAKATVNNRLDWLGGNYQASDTTASVGSCAGGAGQCITVTITLPYKARHVVPPAPQVDSITPTNVKTTAIVQIS